MTTTLDDLLRQRAEDMAALLDAQLPVPSSRLLDPEDPLPAVDLRACSARELAWLERAIPLVPGKTTRTVTVPRATTGVVTPFEPIVLTVMYTARYFVARRPPSAPASPWETYVVYGARKCEALPEGALGLASPDQPT